jgi:hypothetical protein
MAACPSCMSILFPYCISMSMLNEIEIKIEEEMEIDLFPSYNN